MQVALTLAHMCPIAKFDVVQYGDGSMVIENWEHTEAQPTMEEIEAYWVENEAIIMEANKPKPSPVEKEIADLWYTVMMGGLI